MLLDLELKFQNNVTIQQKYYVVNKILLRVLGGLFPLYF